MRTSDTRGDEVLKEVIEDSSGDAKGWFVIIRDGPLQKVGGWTKPAGDVYVLWRKTRELAIEQLKLHQEQANQGYGAPLRELHPRVFDGECNFGCYENGSFLLINADRDASEETIRGLERKLRDAEKSMPIPQGNIAHGYTFTDEYECPGCKDTSGMAEVIIGEHQMWCTTECFRASPPKGWVSADITGLILERNGAEKAEELLEEKIEDLKNKLCWNEQRVLDLEDEVSDAVLDQEFVLDEARYSFEEARGSLVEEITKLKDQRTDQTVRIAELETIVENNLPFIEHQEYFMAKSQLDNSQIISSDNLPDGVNQLIAKAVKKAAKKVAGSACGICNKVLKGPQGVESHQRSTTCGVVLAKAIAADKARALLQPKLDGYRGIYIPQPKTEAVQLAEVAYKRDVMKFQVIQTCIRWVTSASTVGFIAYHLV